MGAAAMQRNVGYERLVSGSPMSLDQLLKHPIKQAQIGTKKHRSVRSGVKPVDESHCADIQGDLVGLRCTRTAGLHNNAQKDPQHLVLVYVSPLPTAAAPKNGFCANAALWRHVQLLSHAS